MIALTLLLPFFAALQSFYSLSNGGGTILRTLGASDHSSISFVNSTSALEAIYLHPQATCFILHVSSSSAVNVRRCNLYTADKLYTPFSSAGLLSLVELNLKAIPSSLASLIQTPQTLDSLVTSSVSVTRCIIDDIEIANTEGTFLSSGFTSSQTLSDSQFLNITISSPVYTTDHLTTVDNSYLIGTIFDSCEDFFYGHIISGVSYKTEHQFLCSNSTFLNSYRTQLLNSRPASNGNGDITGTPGRHSVSDMDYTFKQCTFTGVHTPNNESYGGAICLFPSTNGDQDHRNTGRILQSTFTNCYASKSDYKSLGGAIFMCRIYNAYIRNTSFKNCSVASGDQAFASSSKGGGIYINNTEFFHMRYCDFDNCTAGLHGGGACLKTMTTTNGDGTGALYHCTFHNCTAACNPDSAGGGFYYSNHEGFQINTCSFIKCTTTGTGGGFWYRSEVCPNYEKGLITDTILQLNEAKDSETKNYYFDVPNNCDTSNFVTILPTRYVSSSGKDDDSCGTEDYPCLTIAKAYTGAKPGTNSPKIDVILMTNVDKGDDISINQFTLSISKKDSTATIVATAATSSAPSFAVTTGQIAMTDFMLTTSVTTKALLSMAGDGKIELTDMTVQPASGLGEMTVSLLNINAGTVTLTRTTFTGFHTTVALLSVTSATITGSGSSFSSITRSTAGGVIFDLTSCPTMTISGLAFDACSGPISAGFSNNQVLTLTSLAFQKCHQGAGKGVLTVLSGTATRSNTLTQVFTVDCGDASGGSVSIDNGGSVKASKTTLALTSVTFTIKAPECSLVTGCSGQLSLTSVTMKPADTTATVTASLISVTETCNSVQIRNSKVRNIEGEVPTVFTSNTVKMTEFDMAGTTITNCKRTGPAGSEGGAVYVTMAQAGKLKLDGVVASGCQSAGFGGVFYVDWQTWNTDGPIDVTFSGTQFSGNSAAKDSGADIFFMTADSDSKMNTYTPVTLFNFKVTKAETALYGNRNGETTYNINLLARTNDDGGDTPVYKWYTSTEVYVTGLDKVTISGKEVTPEDATDCGPESKPCKSINYGITHLEPSQQTRQSNVAYTVKIIEKGQIAHYLTLTDLTLTSSTTSRVSIPVDFTDSKTINSVDLDGGLITAAGSVTMSLLNFEFSHFVSTQFTSFITTSADSILTIQQCDLKSNTDGTTPAFISVTQGVTKVQNTDFHPDSTAWSSKHWLNLAAEAQFTSCILYTPRVSQTMTSERSNEELTCSWETGTILISKNKVQFTSMSFENFTQGAMVVSDGATVTFTESSFSNKAKLTNYPSFSRNILCSDSEITFPTTIGASTSLWILETNCKITPQLQSSLFIPILDSASANVQSDKIVVSYDGSLFIPCDVKCVVRINSDDDDAISYPLSELTHTETSFSVTITDESFISKYQEAKLVETYLVFNTDKKTGIKYLKRSAEANGDNSKDGGISLFGANIPLYVFIPVVSFLFLLILLLLLLCIYCFCCRKKQEEVPEERKDLYMAEELPEKHEPEMIATLPDAGASVNSSLMVEGILTKTPHTGVLADVQNSLFSQIHNSAQRQARNPFAWAATVATECIDGLTFMLDRVYGGGRMSGPVPGQRQISVATMRSILAGISPHSILFTDTGDMTLSMVPPSVNIYIFPDSDETDTFESELRRYTPQEVIETGPSRSRQAVEATLVYSLGMLIYEVFTGWVPYDGYKASEAAEMAGNGMRPDTSLISQVDTSFTEIVEKSYAQNPAERFNLADLKSRLAAYLPAQEGQIRAKYRGSDSDSDSL